MEKQTTVKLCPRWQNALLPGSWEHLAGTPICLRPEVGKHKSANRLQSIGQNETLLDANHLFVTDAGMQFKICAVFIRSGA